MRHVKIIAAILLGLAVSPNLWAVEQQATALSEVKVFRNVSGAQRVHGEAMVLQDANTDTAVTIGATDGSATTLGMDITTTTSADVSTFVGCVVDRTCADDALCRVVTWGPAICKWAGSSDNTNTRMATVGTTTTAGLLGSGTLAGLTMSLSLEGPEDTERNGVTDQDTRWIWIAPDNN